MSFRLPPAAELAMLLVLLGAIGLAMAMTPARDPLATTVVTPAVSGLLAGFALLLGLDLALRPHSAARSPRAGRARQVRVGTHLVRAACANGGGPMAGEKQVRVIVGVFKGTDGAAFAFGRIRTGQVRSHNHAVLARDAAGAVRVKEAGDMGAGKGAVIGAVAGLLLPGVGVLAPAIVGGLAAKIHDAGLPNERLRELGERLTPGSSALILLVDPAASALAERILAEAGGTIVAGGLDADLAATTPPD